MTDSTPLTGPEAVASRIDRAGGVVVTRDGRPIVLHYGSVAGELAVCRVRVGIAIRTELSIAEVTGDENRLDELMRGFVDDLGPYVGRIAVDDDLLWSRSDLRELYAISGVPDEQLDSTVRAFTARSVEPPGAKVGHLTALSLIGPRTAELLGRVAGVVPVDSSSISASCAGHPIVLVRGADDRFLLLTAKVQADTVLSALLCHDASLVGMDAVRLNAAARRGLATRC